MRLRNKKTGEIVDADFNATISGRTNTILIQNGSEQLEYGSLAELNEEWEDYEEPKEYYAIDLNGDIIRWARHSWNEKTFNKIKEIGNYFGTREEAEKAVEKLKAWKRLKDKGYRVMMNNHVDGMLYLRIWNDTTDAPTPINKAGKIYKDLALLFGGE